MSKRMMKMDLDKGKSWYSIKGLYRWYARQSGNTISVEERVLLFRAKDFDGAIALAERESVTYCAKDSSADFAIEPLGWWDAYNVGELDLVDGAELYSRLMDTTLSSLAFLRRYYPKSQIHRGADASTP